MSSPASKLVDRFSSAHVVVLVLLSMGMADAYVTRTAGAYNTTLRAEFELDNTQVGLALSGFELGYIWLQIPGGWFGQVLGNRRALPLMCLGWSLCAALWALAPSPQVIFMARFGMGLFQGGLIPCSAMAVAEWYTPRLRGITSGVITSSMQIGAIVALQCTASLLSLISWRSILMMYASLGLLWVVAFWIFYRDRPSEHPWLRDTDADPAAAAAPVPASSPFSWSTALALLGTASLWLLCTQMFFRAFAYSFFQNWFPAYLERGRGLSRLDSSTLTLPPIIAVLIGGLIGGSLVDLIFRRTGSKYLSRSGTAVLAMFASAGCTLAASQASDPRAAVLVITCGAFFAGVAGPVTWAAVIDVFGKRTGVLLGMVNMCGNIGAYCCASSLGRLFDAIETSRGNWNLVLYLFAGIYCLAASCWLFLDPARSPASDD